MKVNMNPKSLYQYFASQKEASWIMHWENVVQLYQFVKRHDVKNILDLGTGIGMSAAITALALEEKGIKDYRIDTIEQYEKCVKLAKQLIPEILRKNITFHLSEAVIWQTEKIPYQYFSIYKELPEGNFDLLIQDGPGPMDMNGHFIDLPNGMIHKLTLEDKLKPGIYIAFDGRIQSLKSLERYLGENFYLINPGKKGNFNVIQKKDMPLKFEDVMMTEMKKLNYFNETPQTGNQPSPNL